MGAFGRTDTSIMGRWWWTIDRWTMASVALLFAFGTLMTLAASPPVAERIGLDSYYFVRRQFAYVPVSLALMIGVSMLSVNNVRRVALAGFAVSLAFLAATLIVGVEIKGATRWISLGPLSLQPSELIKPCFIVVSAWLLAADKCGQITHGRLTAFASFGLVVGLLMLQPDFGMAVVVSAVWFCQFFVAGMSVKLVLLFLCLGVLGSISAYVLLPHVASRVDRFIDPASGDSYQISRSLEAFMNGGLFGRGPGEGTVKTVLPDAHSDFIFAVAGEEFGIAVCALVVLLFAFVVLRGFARLFREDSFFVLLAVTGLLVQFGLQAIINMGSALSLMPTKGMTLPFISYGGSSLVGVSLGIGMLLALTRRRTATETI